MCAYLGWMRTNLPVRMIGSFPSAMRRRTVFAEQPLTCANSPTVSRRSGWAGRLVSFRAIGTGLLLLEMLCHLRTRSRTPEKPGERKNGRMWSRDRLLQDGDGHLLRSGRVR